MKYEEALTSLIILIRVANRSDQDLITNYLQKKNHLLHILKLYGGIDIVQ